MAHNVSIQVQANEDSLKTSNVKTQRHSTRPSCSLPSRAGELTTLVHFPDPLQVLGSSPPLDMVESPLCPIGSGLWASYTPFHTVVPASRPILQCGACRGACDQAYYRHGAIRAALRYTREGKEWEGACGRLQWPSISSISAHLRRFCHN